MSITSLSFNFVNLYAPPVARPAAASERQAAPAAMEDRCCGAPRPGGPENRLVQAMLSAFRELGFGSVPASGSSTAVTANATAAAPSLQASVAEAVTTQATSATAATAEGAANAASAAQRDASAAASSTQPTPTPAPTVESAVQQFAHELFRALREGGRGDASEQPAGRVDGERGHRRHHGHQGMRGHGYGDMSQRLQTLSQTFGATAPAPATATPEAQPSAVAAKEFSITLPVTDGQVDVPALTPTRAVSPPTARVATEATAATDVPKSSAVNPLLEAFSKLFTALKPHSAALPETGMADKLRLFLQTLAQALRPEAMHSLQTPQVGGLVNVVA